MVLAPIPQSLPVHFFGSRPQPPTSPSDANHPGFSAQFRTTHHGSKGPRKKSTKLLQRICSIQASKSPKRDLRDSSETKNVYANRKIKFKNFMHREWREEKFLERYCGSQHEATLLKQAPKDRPCIHAAGALQLNACKSFKLSTFTTWKFD